MNNRQLPSTFTVDCGLILSSRSHTFKVALVIIVKQRNRAQITPQYEQREPFFVRNTQSKAIQAVYCL